ncbi:hypothetical protein Dimus_024324 [Dionaea muscipula]
MTQEMSKLACTCAPYKETYVIFMDMVHETSRKVGIAIDSLMSRRAIEEAAAQKVVEENARVDERIADAWGGSRGADAWGGSGQSIGVSTSNDPDLRDSSTPNVSSSQFKILDPNVSQTKGQKKGREVVGGSSRMKSAMGRNRDLVASSSDELDVLMEEDGDSRDE